MKRFFLFCAGVFFLAYSPLGFANAGNHLNAKASEAMFSTQVDNSRLQEWQSYMAEQRNMRRRALKGMPAVEAERTLPASNSVNYLNGPDGTTWTYTIDHTVVSGYIQSVDVRVYNGKQEKVGEFTDSFEALDHTTFNGVNYVQLNPLITQKFFNSDNHYEVMLFVHVVTTDYQGYYFNDVFSLGTGEKIGTVPGNQVLGQNTATDAWSENWTLVFQRDSTETVGEGEEEIYTTYFDVYKKAGWSTPYTKVHTFKMDYALISGASENAIPIMMQKHNGQLCYVTAQFEKEFFDPTIPWEQEPVVQPDNAFVLTLYNQSFDIVATTRIPCEVEDESVFTSPFMGGLRYNDDVAFDFFPEADTAYIVSFANFRSLAEEFKYSYYVYDLNGNRIKTIATNAETASALSDVRGQEEQYCFVYPDDANATFRFVNLPSCEEVLQLPSSLSGNMLSASMDRYPVGNSYQYVVSVSNGDVDAENNVYHSMAWLNANGTLNHIDKVNLGKDIRLAQANVDARVMDPYIFNTDAAREYMFLVKRARTSGSTATDELLYIVNADGTLLLELGPDDTKGLLSYITLLNADTEPILAVTYYSSAKAAYTPMFIDLPLNSLAGEGTAEKPYEIATAGDFRQIKANLKAHYRIVNDIDFDNVPFAGINGDFKGVLDGQNHVLSNLVLEDNGLFKIMQDSAVVKNLRLYSPVLSLNRSSKVGFIANHIASLPDVKAHCTVSNVYIYNAKVENGEAFDGQIGGIAGSMALGSEISQCALFDADIVLSEDATAGGIVGSVNTGSKVLACAFTGSLSAGVTAGIVGECSATDALISNCHSNANLVGTGVVAGIIGETNRSRISNCYAEGTLAAKGGRFHTYVGGIAGSVQVPATVAKDTVIANCLVGIGGFVLPENAKDVVAHRIVGYTRGDEKMEDWDVTNDWTDEDWDAYYAGEKEIPYVMGKPDIAYFGNYVTSDLAVVDESVLAKDSTVEGATLPASDMTVAFMESHLFQFGETLSAPWVYAPAPYLWYENAVAGLLVNPEHSNLFVGETLDVTFTLLHGKGAEIKVATESAFLSIEKQEADGENLHVTVKATGVGTAVLRATYGDLSVDATVVCEKAHIKYDAAEGSVSVTYTAADEVQVERERTQPVSLFIANRADGSDKVLLRFYHTPIDDDITIPVGVYPINATEEEGTVLASVGVDANSELTPSYYTTLKEGIAETMYFMVTGTVTVEKSENGMMKLTVDARNSYDLPIRIVYDGTETALENSTMDTTADTYKFIRDGQLYIYHNGTVYTVTGASLQ